MKEHLHSPSVRSYVLSSSAKKIGATGMIAMGWPYRILGQSGAMVDKAAALRMKSLVSRAACGQNGDMASWMSDIMSLRSPRLQLCEARHLCKWILMGQKGGG